MLEIINLIAEKVSINPNMKKIALVIGINDYKHFDNLENSRNDANDMHKFLEKNEFEVTPLFDLNKHELENAINEYKQKIDNQTISVFYFSGHGFQLEQYNFLVSKDSEINTLEDIPYNSTNISSLFSDISDDVDFTHIVILDACRKTLFSTGLGKVTAGMGMDTPRKGTIIAYAAAPGKASIERKKERNGVFTKNLLKNIAIPNVNIEQALKNTRTELLSDTNNKQISWEESSLHDEFCFIVEDVAILEFQEIIEQFLGTADNPLLQKVLPFLQPKYFHELSLEHLHLALSLNIIAFEDEQEEKIQATIDPDYFQYDLLLERLTLFQTRIVNEDICENIFDNTILEQIEIINGTNYGYNEVLSAEDAFPHFMISQIKYNGSEGLLACFSSFIEGLHYIKPMIFLKNDTLQTICFKAMIGNRAIDFLKKFVELRKPFEKDTPNLMNVVEDVEINTPEELWKFFNGDDTEDNN
ncbi:caspase family protein [Leeuwenhoekiella aestuarii]|nr:caspase family protein [Leeuwenhoekiella aestuarii]